MLAMRILLLIWKAAKVSISQSFTNNPWRHYDSLEDCIHLGNRRLNIWIVQRCRGTSLFLDVFLVQYISCVFLLQIKGQQTRLITDRMYEIHHQGRSCLHKSSFSNYWRRPALFTLATGNHWKQMPNFKRPQNKSITEAFNLMMFYLFRWRPIWSKQNSQ